MSPPTSPIVLRLIAVILSAEGDTLFDVCFFDVPREQAGNWFTVKGVNEAEPNKAVSFVRESSRFSAACAITDAISAEPLLPLPSLKNTESFSEVVISSIGMKIVGISENNLRYFLAKAYEPALPECSEPVIRQQTSVFWYLKLSSENCFNTLKTIDDGIRLELIPDEVFDGLIITSPRA